MKYFRMGEMMRIDAAKQLFNSFATRTQAYKLHHALGLTIFGSKVTVKLKLTKDTENFEVLKHSKYNIHHKKSLFRLK